ncbi:MAG: hypothetical protein ACJA1C_000480 [Crocinitomicaceae bacterium]|jgi:hypothetical protein
MQIGIVEGKHSKSVRWIFYIGIPLLLLISYPVLDILNLDIGYTWIVFSILCISGFAVIHKVADDVIFKGEMEINEDSFSFHLNEETTSIPFKDIKMVLLYPMLGLSKIPDTFKSYKCQIKTHDNVYTYQITREELKDGKLIAKNILNPKAFDLIKFLDKQKINYRFGKRIN